jgi:hypothetical protein
MGQGRNQRHYLVFLAPISGDKIAVPQPQSKALGNRDDEPVARTVRMGDARSARVLAFRAGGSRGLRFAPPTLRSGPAQDN